MPTDLAKQNDAALDFQRPRAESTTESLIRVALQQGQNPTELYAILREERAHAAKAAFIQAKAEFQRECPPVPRSQLNPQFSVSTEGAGRSAMFAPLDAMQTIADPILHKHGFSYEWKDTGSEDDSAFRVCFVLSHVGGHSEQYHVSISKPSKAGCNEPQKDGIAYEYARRQSFRNGTGIRVIGADMDANVDTKPRSEVISEEQGQTINDLLVELADSMKADHQRTIDAFKAGFKVRQIADLPAAKFEEAVANIKGKIAARKK